MSITIRQAYEQFYEPTRPALSPRTVERYRLEILRWERHTPNPTIDVITTQTFNNYRATCLAAGLKATTIEAGIRTVLQVLRLCGPEQERREGLGLIAKVPYVGRALRQHSAYRPTPTVSELRLLYSFCGVLQWPPQCDTANFWRCWIGVSFVTGLRLTDMFLLSGDCLSGDVLSVKSHKTGLSHVFVLPPWLVVELARLPKGDRLFPCKRLPCFIRRELKRLCDRLGIQIVTPHGLRRACVTEWSAINSDCGRLIHGEGLAIRSRYVDPVALLRRHVVSFPDLSRIQ